MLTYFENEKVPGVLQSSIQQKCVLREYQTIKTESRNPGWPDLCVFGMLAKRLFLTLDWRTPRPTSFLNSPDCVIISVSEYSVETESFPWFA